MTTAVLYRDRFTDEPCVVVGLPYLDCGEYWLRIRSVEYNSQNQTACYNSDSALPVAADDIERIGEVRLV